jgi:hypothetical protein
MFNGIDCVGLQWNRCTKKLNWLDYLIETLLLCKFRSGSMQFFVHIRLFIETTGCRQVHGNFELLYPIS